MTMMMQTGLGYCNQLVLLTRQLIELHGREGAVSKLAIVVVVVEV